MEIIINSSKYLGFDINYIELQTLRADSTHH